LIEKAAPFLEYAVDTIVRQVGGTMHGKSVAARTAMEFASNIRQDIDRQVFLERVAAELSLSRESLRVQAVRRVQEPENNRPASVPLDLSPGERTLVEAVLLRPDLARQVCQDQVFELIVNESLRSMFRNVLDEYEEFGEVEPHDLVGRLADPALKDLCAGILMDDRQKDPLMVERSVAELIPKMRRKSIRKQMDQLRLQTRRVASRGELEEQLVLARRLEELERELFRLDHMRN